MTHVMNQFPPLAIEPPAAEPRLVVTRSTFKTIAIALLTIPDSRLSRLWRPAGDVKLDVRDGLYHAHVLLEEAAGRAVTAVPREGFQPAFALATALRFNSARWEFKGGPLLSLSESKLDRPPRPGEWTVRQTLTHVIRALAGWAWMTSEWLRRTRAGEPLFPLARRDAPLPPDEELGAGSLVTLVARFDRCVDVLLAMLRELGQGGKLDEASDWFGLTLRVRTYVAGWSTHVREHTIQLDKTVALLGHESREVERIVRLLCRAYSALEAPLLLLPAEKVIVDLFEDSAKAMVALGRQVVAASRIS
jgi:hypothetical protein